MTPPDSIILASSSPYRKALLQRLGLEFRTLSPDIDETPRAGETPRQLVLRLAAAKAARVAERETDSLIIASDQVAELDGAAVSKPGGRERAREQLRALSGRTVRFLTGLCLLHAASGRAQTDCVEIPVCFRTLTPAEIDRYLDREQPWDCAGAFKSEGYGIVLTEAVAGTDPTALVGLPLIRLAAMLREEGLSLP